MDKPRVPGRRHPIARTAGLVALALTGLTCRDRSLTGPGLPVSRALDIAPVFSVAPAGGPSLRLRTAHGTLIPIGGGDTATADAIFAGDSAVLDFTATFFGPAQSYRVEVDAADSTGEVLFHAGDSIRVAAGDAPVRDLVTMRYVAPDARLRALTVAPRDTVLASGDSLRLRLSGTDSSGAAVGAIRAGFTSRDSTVAVVTAAGVVRGGALQRGAWIVARTWTGIADSAYIRVQAPVARVAIAPSSARVVRGDTLRLHALALDAAGDTLAGRAVAWQSLDANATVDGTGLVTGAVANGMARIVATSEGKSDTAQVTVDPRPVARVSITPDTLRLVVGDSVAPTATPLDSAGQPDHDWTVTWAVKDTLVAALLPSGKLQGRAAGTTSLLATADGVTGSAVVIVGTSAGPIVSTTVAPHADTLRALGDTARLTVRSLDGTQTAVTGSYGWTSRDTTVAAVDAAGLVSARANGATWVVVAESGGTSDSARIVVQQAVSTVSVTPGFPTILYGATQQFTAAALDGRGNAIPGARFTWASRNAAVASIDTTGLATAAGVGVDTITATAGGISGHAFLTVKSPIARIAITPDTLTMTSLGLSQVYRAVAYDSAGAALTGQKLSWATSNPSVGSITSSSDSTATVQGVGNGATAIRASALGVTGEASLVVQQALAGIELSPLTATIGINGNASIVARGKDANGRYITGLAGFAFQSDDVTVATVDGNGLVTGVNLGTAHITATSGGITSSPAATITVSNQVPPVLSFGRDTLALGRGSSFSIPIYLSTPSASPVTVSLSSSRTTVASFPTAQVTIPAGATAANVTVSTDSAGEATVVATDAQGAYAADTAVIDVQANVRLSIGSFSLNATDQKPAQVLLSDPAPAGGVYVSFEYSAPNVALVSPDPAFIPGGQLAADVTIQGTGAGKTYVKPSAAGVRGDSIQVTVQPANLTIYYGSQIIGAGQYEQSYDFVQLPATTNAPVTIALTSSDTSVLQVQPATLTIPAGGSYAYYSVYGLKPGVATVTAAAPGWTSSTSRETVTTPAISLCCGTTINTTSPAVTYYVYVQDSTRNSHERINDLVVNVRSTNPSIVQVLDTTVVVKAGSYDVPVRFQPVAGSSGGSVWIVPSAGGHITTDSLQVTVQAPQLAITCGNGCTMGAGQQGTSWGYVQIPNALSQPLTVTIANADTTIAATAPTITIPSGATYTYYDLRGHATGTTRLVASAPGFAPDSIGVTVTTPYLSSGGSRTVPAYTAPQSFSIYAQDSVGYGHKVLGSPVVVTLASSDTLIATTDSSQVTIPVGASVTSAAKLVYRNAGTAWIHYAAPGYLTRDSIQVTVTPSKLVLGYSQLHLGARQYSGSSGEYVQISAARSDSAVTITLQNLHPTLASLDSATITLPTGTTYRYFGYTGLAAGVDTVIASAPGYLPDTVTLTVTTPQLQASGLPSSAVTTANPANVYIYPYDSLGSGHYAADTVTVHVTVSDTTVLRPDSAYIHILPGQSSVYVPVRYIGIGTASVTVADSAGQYRPFTTNVVSVTGPSLGVYPRGTTTSPVTLGMHQQLGTSYMYVQTPNAVTSPLTVTIASSDSMVARVPASVTIPTGSSYAYFNVIGGDTTGTVQLTMTATGYQSATTIVQVGRPTFYISTTTSAYAGQQAQTVYVYSEDQAGNDRDVVDTLRVSLTSSAPGVAATDSSTVTILPGSYYSSAARMSYLATGTTDLVASDPRAAFYHFAPDTVPITVQQPYVEISIPAYGSVGKGQKLASSYVWLPTSMAQDVVVTLQHTGSATTSPATVTVAAGSSSSPYFDITGAALGTDSITPVASGYTSYGGLITVGTGTLQLSNLPASLAVGDSVLLTLRTYEQNGSYQLPVAAATTFTLSANSSLSLLDTSGQPITSVTVPAGSSSVQLYVKATASGTGTLSISNADYVTFNGVVTVP